MDGYDEYEIRAIVNRLQRRSHAGGRIAMLEDPVFRADRTSMPVGLRKLLNGIEDNAESAGPSS